MKPYENPARLLRYLELRRVSLNPISNLQSDLRQLNNQELVVELYRACVRMQKLLNSTEPLFSASHLRVEAHDTLLYLEDLQRKSLDHRLYTSNQGPARETMIAMLARLIVDMMQHILDYRERVALVGIIAHRKRAALGRPEDYKQPDPFHLLCQGLSEIPDLSKNFPSK